MKVEVKVMGARLRAPFVSASGTVSARELLLLRLTDADGVVGIGEAAPLPPYDGVTIGDVCAALEDCRATLSSSDGADHRALLIECGRRTVLPQALAAIDLALWDLAGRRAAKPVWELLGAPSPGPVLVNATIASADRAGAASNAAAARTAGFGTVKMKVGIGDDAGRLAAVRAAAGPELAIRIDAGGAWSPEQARAALQALEPAGLELCEEPVSGLEATARLAAQTTVPIAIDESAGEPGALDRRACAAVCLKVARHGGISGVIEAAERARQAGYDIYLASTLEGPIGIAAALHSAAAIQPTRASGLATLAVFDGRENALPAENGRIPLPTGCGLGDGLSDWYA